MSIKDTKQCRSFIVLIIVRHRTSRRLLLDVIGRVFRHVSCVRRREVQMYCVGIFHACLVSNSTDTCTAFPGSKQKDTD